MSIQYLKHIICNKNLKMREDLMCFARILRLFAHYEAGMDYHLEIQLKSTYKFLYLDIISWLESHIENKPIAQTITEKALSLKR